MLEIFQKTQTPLKFGMMECMRELYDHNKKLVFQNKSTYSLDHSHIYFNDFLLNENNINATVEYNADHLTNAYLGYQSNFIRSAKIYVDYDNEYYYLKN